MNNCLNSKARDIAVCEPDTCYEALKGIPAPTRNAESRKWWESTQEVVGKHEMGARQKSWRFTSLHATEE
jgi:hypothetical protein